MKEKNPKTEASISCTVSQGMFSSERGVSVELPDGRKVTAFVDKRDVIVDRDPLAGEEVRGRVKVSVIEKQKDSVVVDLPQPTITSGPRLRVPRVLLD